jgi:NifU-like domain
MALATLAPPIGPPSKGSTVTDDSDIRQDLERIGGLVEKIESIADPAMRAAAKDLVQSLMEMHGAALERALDIVSEAGGPGMAIIGELGRDPVVSSVLLLYGLHPENLEGRVRQALDRLRPQLRKQGCEVKLLDATGGAIRLQAEISAYTCGSTAKLLRETLEAAIYDAAPDLTSFGIEGFDEKPASGFVALDRLTAVDSGRPGASTWVAPQGD